MGNKTHKITKYGVKRSLSKEERVALFERALQTLKKARIPSLKPGKQPDSEK